MLTFNNDPELKLLRIKRAKSHIKQDKLIQGSYTDGIRGCSVGCEALDIGAAVFPSDPHRYVAGYYHTPVWLERLRDVIFEGMTKKAAKEWHLHLTEAIPVGINIDPVWHKFMLWLLSPESDLAASLICTMDLTFDSEDRKLFDLAREFHRRQADSEVARQTDIALQADINLLQDKLKRAKTKTKKNRDWYSPASIRDDIIDAVSISLYETGNCPVDYGVILRLIINRCSKGDAVFEAFSAAGDKLISLLEDSEQII